MSVLYPVAANPDAALAQPLGRAAREREAQALAAGQVEFVSELTGPAFASQAEALAAFRGRIETQPEDRFCILREIAAEGVRKSALRPIKPSYKNGHRWPEPKPPPPTVWRLSISYWRIVDESRFDHLAQARLARRTLGADRLDPQTLQALSEQPLRPVRPQQPLDVGLFEISPPEAPHITMPDE